MKLKEYLHLVLHPNRVIAKYLMYIQALESHTGLAISHDRILVNPKDALIVLGRNVIVRDSEFHNDQRIIVHPDGDNIVIANCVFLDTPSQPIPRGILKVYPKKRSKTHK